MNYRGHSPITRGPNRANGILRNVTDLTYSSVSIARRGISSGQLAFEKHGVATIN